MSFPVDASTRQRLLEAQRAEADAIRNLESAAKARDRITTRLVAAEAKVTAAQRALIETSGIERASRLLAIEVSTLRRDLRASD